MKNLTHYIALLILLLPLTCRTYFYNLPPGSDPAKAAEIHLDGILYIAKINGKPPLDEYKAPWSSEYLAPGKYELHVGLRDVLGISWALWPIAFEVKAGDTVYICAKTYGATDFIPYAYKKKPRECGVSP